ncbi:hypothetical protein PhCBS80983_g03620 [Powellomyces hirtus]|uniref:Uncharacterized protein n=1 Tax=Powellomyces hirtus TaxID=109895 RepID=A0A507E3Q9_9FUNG|nr:hypothetical protein PhCBS80983_g03620 [Powellomyces hirtus]
MLVQASYTAVSYTATEYLHLVELICPDFSRDVIVEAAVLAAQAASGPVGAPKDTNVTKYKIPAANFLACLKVCFLYLEFIELSRRAIRLASTKFPAPCFLEKTTNNLICKVNSVEERDALTKALVDALTTALADAPQQYA